jgi:hypothetical protein
VSGTRALAIARERGQKGDEAGALHLLGGVAAQHGPGEPEGVERYLRPAIGLAEELSMRPLVARCHFTLAGFYRRVGDRGRAGHELKAADALFRQMGMRFWLARVEAEGIE